MLNLSTLMYSFIHDSSSGVVFSFASDKSYSIRSYPEAPEKKYCCTNSLILYSSKMRNGLWRRIRCLYVFLLGEICLIRQPPISQYNKTMVISNSSLKQYEPSIKHQLHDIFPLG